MRAYVLGAGASYPIYPLGGSLLECIDEFTRSCGKCHDRFDYDKEWPATLKWLEENSNPLLREAYRSGNIEQIFTILDFAESLRQDSLFAIWRAGKKGPEIVSRAEKSFESLNTELSEYGNARRILLRATEAYFHDHHHKDRTRISDQPWETLTEFAEKLSPGDVVITFNYDSTIERVLLAKKKWSPKDGYGTELVFQRAAHDTTVVEFPSSPVKVLHLHGAIGWYKKPHFKEDFVLDDNAGAVPRAALTPAPLETEISLDPIFLRDFDFESLIPPEVAPLVVDASMPRRPPDEYQILLHPSFLKDYAGEDAGDEIFRRMWKLASDAMRAADRVTIIGYSLPAADTAAWVLLLTSCERNRTDIVNPDRTVMARYRRVLRLPMSRPPITFTDWLKNQ